MNFDRAADELHRQEFARLAAYVTPRPEQLRSMTAAALRVEVASTWDRISHDIITSPDAAELVTVKGDRKFITICGNPADLAPTGTAAVRRLRDRVVAASAERGFYISVRGFSAEALHYAETAPVQLIDLAALIRALHRSRKGMQLPKSYKAMCRQCGDIVQHQLSSDEAKRCGNRHFVAPTIALADLVKPRQPTPAAGTGDPKPRHAPKMIRFRNMHPKAQIKRRMRAHNSQAARARQQHEGGQ
jgi:Restriction endonuclease